MVAGATAAFVTPLVAPLDLLSLVITVAVVVPNPFLFHRGRFLLFLLAIATTSTGLEGLGVGQATVSAVRRFHHALLAGPRALRLAVMIVGDIGTLGLKPIVGRTTVGIGNLVTLAGKETILRGSAAGIFPHLFLVFIFLLAVLVRHFLLGIPLHLHQGQGTSGVVAVPATTAGAPGPTCTCTAGGGCRAAMGRREHGRSPRTSCRSGSGGEDTAEGCLRMRLVLLLLSIIVVVTMEYHRPIGLILLTHNGSIAVVIIAPAIGAVGLDLLSLFGGFIVILVRLLLDRPLVPSPGVGLGPGPQDRRTANITVRATVDFLSVVVVDVVTIVAATGIINTGIAIISLRRRLDTLFLLIRFHIRLL